MEFNVSVRYVVTVRQAIQYSSLEFRIIELATRLISSSKERRESFSILALSFSLSKFFIIIIFLSLRFCFLALLSNKDNLAAANLALACVMRN